MADGSVKIDIIADDSDVKKTLDGVGDEAESAAGGLDKLGSSAEDAGKGFGAADAAIGTFVGNALTQLGSKIIETVGNIAALADETREYREDMAKLDTAFTTAGHSTETAQKAYDDFYKLLGESDRSVEAVNHLAELTSNEQELAQWSTIAAGVTAKFGDSLPIEGLTEAANETAKVGKVTGPLADALNWASAESSVFADALGGNDAALKAFNEAVADGANVEDAFSAALAEMSTEQERSTAITSTLNGLYAEAGAEYNELTASAQAARDATNNMEQAQAALGAAIEPVTTAWTNMKANALQWFVDEGLPALQTGWQWVLDNLPAIAVIVGGLTAAWLAFGGAQTLVNAVQTAGIAIQGALNAVMSANPIGLVILAITALVAGFMLLWNNCEGFRNFWKGLWEGIKTAAKAVSDWFKTAWSATLDWFKGAVAGIKEFFSNAWEAVKQVFSNSIIGAYFKAIWETIKGIFSVVKSVLSGNWSDAWNAIKGICSTWAGYYKTVWESIKAVFSVVGSWFASIFTAAWNGIKSAWSSVVSFFSGIWESIKAAFSAVGSWFSSIFASAVSGIRSAFSSVVSFFSGIWSQIKNVFNDAKSKFLSIGSNIVAGIRQGISNAWSNLVSWFSGLFGDLKSIAKRILGIASPSKWFRDQIGRMIVRGLAIGIEKEADKPKKALATVIDNMRGYVTDYFKEEAKTIRSLNDQHAKEISDHYETLGQLSADRNKEHAEIEAQRVKDEKEYNEKVSELNSKLAKDKAKKDANIAELEAEHNKELAELDQKRAENIKSYGEKHLAINEKYDKAIEDENKRHSDALVKIEEEKNDLIAEKMQELVDLGEKYKDETKTLWEDLDKSITDLQANYDNQLASRTESIASSLNLWDEASKNKVGATTLIKNLNSQIKLLESYNNAIAKLEERGVSEEFLNEIKKMGVDSTGEIEALTRMTDDALTKYVEKWEKKNELARTAALEELEPLKAETEKQIEELTNAAIVKYEEMRMKFKAEGAVLAEDLRQAISDAGLEGYNEIESQIYTYTVAGSDLMDGVVTGIVSKSPLLAEAVKKSVTNAINAAKQAAGIASPSKVMKKEIGYNLADGVSVGWSDKIADLKNKMAADMQGITARIKTAVTLENARMAQGVGVRDTGFSEVAQAVGMQTAGINSLASEYRRGSSAQVTVPLIIDGREFGRAVVDLGSAETVRTGANLVMA